MRLLFASVTVFCIALSAPSYAEDKALSSFTKTISDIYTTSDACKNTLSPGPQEYLQLITAYFSTLYEKGPSYWVLQPASHPITDQMTCSQLLQTHIFNYKVARHNYTYYYPQKSPPPILVAYRWDDRNIELAPVAPVRSYQPANPNRGETSVQKIQ